MKSNKFKQLLFFVGASILFMGAARHQSKAWRLIVFQGSDWCAQCILFERNVLSDSTFIRFTQKHTITIVRVDFRQRMKLDSLTQERNNAMAEKFDFEGKFPTVVLANDADSVLLSTQPKRKQNADGFITLLKEKMKH